jgi:hypothetical protein
LARHGYAAIIIAFIGKLIADDAAKAALPIFTRWLLRRAVLKLKPEHRMEFANGVTATLRKWPGILGKLLIALWFIWRSRGLIQPPPLSPRQIAAELRVRSSLWGLLLLVGSFLIIYTINPDALYFDFSQRGHLSTVHGSLAAHLSTLYIAAVALGALLAVFILTISGIQYILATDMQQPSSTDGNVQR